MSDAAAIEELRRENAALKRALVEVALAQTEALHAFADAAAGKGPMGYKPDARETALRAREAAKKTLDAVRPFVFPACRWTTASRSIFGAFRKRT